MSYELINFFKHLSSKTKLEIILHLYTCKCSKNVNSICDCLKQKQPNISKHLMQLKTDKIISFDKNGVHHHMKLNDEFVKAYSELLKYIVKKYKNKNYLCQCDCCKNGDNNG